MRTKITQRTADNATPAGKPYEIHDTDLKGFMLRVQPSGARSFVVTWGRGKRRTLGRYPVMTVSGARAAALAALAESVEHGAPLAVIEASKPAGDKPLTLGDFIAQHYAPWALAHQKAGQATIDALGSVWGGLYDKLLTEVCAFDVERVKSKRLKAGRTVSTVNRDLDRIRGALSRAVDWGFLSANPIKTVKRGKADNSRVRYLADDENRRLRKALQDREDARRAHRDSGNTWCKERGGDGRPMWPADGFTDHLMPMVLLAMNTGMRRGELLGLRWQDVNLPMCMLTVTAGNAKSKQARHLPLNAEAQDVLTRWRRQTGGNGLVFSGADGERMGHIKTSWEGVLEAAKLSDFRFHDLRHDFASKLVMAGVDLNTVRELLGHADLKMTLRYAHLAPQKLAAAVAMLGAV